MLSTIVDRMRLRINVFLLLDCCYTLLIDTAAGRKQFLESLHSAASNCIEQTLYAASRGASNNTLAIDVNAQMANDKILVGLAYIIYN